MIVVDSGLLRPNRMRLNELFSVERVLASRGFRVTKQGEGLDTHYSKSFWTSEEANLLFEVFDDRVRRTQLLRLSSGESISELDPSVQRLTSTSGFALNRDAFSHTFEWYVGELLVRRFGAFSSSYSVEVSDIQRNSDGGTSGDYDVLSVLGSMDFLYLECKTGGFNTNKIFNMLERARSLHVLASVMFVEEISPNSLKAQVENIVYPGLSIRPSFYHASVKNLPESKVYQLHDAFFLSASLGSVNVEEKLKAVLRLISCKRAELNRDISPDENSYRGAGYEITELLPYRPAS